MFIDSIGLKTMKTKLARIQIRIRIVSKCVGYLSILIHITYPYQISNFFISGYGYGTNINIRIQIQTSHLVFEPLRWDEWAGNIGPAFIPRSAYH
jgi:hypothetical protein